MREQKRNLAGIPIGNHTRVTVEHTRLRELPQNTLAIRPEVVSHQHRRTVSFRHNGAQGVELCRMELSITAGAVLGIQRTISRLQALNRQGRRIGRRDFLPESSSTKHLRH